MLDLNKVSKVLASLKVQNIVKDGKLIVKAGKKPHNYPKAKRGEKVYIDKMSEDEPGEYGIFGLDSGHCYYYGSEKECEKLMKEQYSDRKD